MNPHAWGPPPPTETPATALKTLGILSIVFSVLNALGNGLAIAQAAFSARLFASPGFGGGASASPDAEASFNAMREYTSTAMRVGAGEGGLMVVMDIALFTIGILLLKRSEAGRKAAIGWAIAGVVVLALRAAAFELLLWPAYARMLAGMGTSGSGGFGGTMSGFARAGTYGSLLFMAIFPTCLAVILSLPTVKATVAERQGDGAMG